MSTTSVTNPMQPIAMVCGATLPGLNLVVKGSTNVPVDITGYTVSIDIKRPDGTVFTVVGTLTDAPNGKASFAWQTSTWNQVGRFVGQLVLLTPTGDVLKQGNVLFNVESAFR